MSGVRYPILGGTWYPADAEELAASVDGFLEGADPQQKPAGRPWLAVVPHAGHIYSGPVAGKLFGLLKDDPPRRIFLLAPNHRAATKEIALPEESAFATPLGALPLDRGLIDELATKPGFGIIPNAHHKEHALEIVLPFVQRTWPDNLPLLVPMLVPMNRADVLRSMATTLHESLDENDLLLVSSDFTHFGSNFGFVPFEDDVPMALERLDAGALLKILAGDAEGLLEYGRETGITMCGLAACFVALGEGPPEGYEAALLDYSRSGDRDGDYSHSVSYAAVLLSRGEAHDECTD